MKQNDSKKKLVNIAILEECRPQIRKIAEKSGLKMYALISEAVNLWAKTNGYNL